MSWPRDEIIYANQVYVTSAPFICAILDRAVSLLDVYCLSERRMGQNVNGCPATINAL